MHRIHAVVTDSGPRSFFLSHFCACIRLQDRYTGRYYLWLTGICGVISFEQKTCERQGRKTGGSALTWSTRNLCSQTSTTRKIYWTKSCYAKSASIKISLCAKLRTLNIIISINPLTARVVGAPQMIFQPVFSIFPCSPLPSGTCRTPGLSIPCCCLPTSSHLFTMDTKGPLFSINLEIHRRKAAMLIVRNFHCFRLVLRTSLCTLQLKLQIQTA